MSRRTFSFEIPGCAEQQRSRAHRDFQSGRIECLQPLDKVGFLLQRPRSDTSRHEQKIVAGQRLFLRIGSDAQSAIVRHGFL